MGGGSKKGSNLPHSKPVSPITALIYIQGQSSQDYLLYPSSLSMLLPWKLNNQLMKEEGQFKSKEVDIGGLAFITDVDQVLE